MVGVDSFRSNLGGGGADGLLKCREWLPRFFNDAEKEVRDGSMTFLHKHLDWAGPGNIDVLRHFVGSQSFLDDPTRLLWELGDYREDLRPLASVLFDACDRMTDPAITQTLDHAQSWAFDLDKLTQLLLALYGQTDRSPADARIRKACLDRWDQVLRQGHYVSPAIIVALDN